MIPTPTGLRFIFQCATPAMRKPNIEAKRHLRNSGRGALSQRPELRDALDHLHRQHSFLAVDFDVERFPPARRFGEFQLARERLAADVGLELFADSFELRAALQRELDALLVFE